MSENINFKEQWYYIVCSKMKNKDVATSEDIQKLLQSNKELWDSENKKNFETIISGILSSLSKEETLRIDKTISNQNDYVKGKKFTENMDKYAQEVIEQLDLKDDGNGLICKDHGKVIMTDEQLEELWKTYVWSSEEENPADMAAAMRQYHLEK